jgi:hypothetical protein
MWSPAQIRGEVYKLLQSFQQELMTVNRTRPSGLGRRLTFRSRIRSWHVQEVEHMLELVGVSGEAYTRVLCVERLRLFWIGICPLFLLCVLFRDVPSSSHSLFLVSAHLLVCGPTSHDPLIGDTRLYRLRTHIDFLADTLRDRWICMRSSPLDMSDLCRPLKPSDMRKFD